MVRTSGNDIAWDGGEGNISSTVRTSTQGQFVCSDIAIHISNYCVYCIEDLSLTHRITAQSTEIFQGIQKPTTCPHISLTIVLLYWISESGKHNINAQTFFKESRNLIWTAIAYADIDRSKKLYRPVAPVYTRFLDRSISVSQSVSRNSEGQMESV